MLPQVLVVLNGEPHFLNQDGSIANGGGFQFATLADGVVALGVALAANPSITSFRSVLTPA